jgi:hypothetical protein
MIYSISAKGRLLEVRVSGQITRAEIYKCWDKLELHPNYQEATAGMVVFEDSPDWKVTGTEIAMVGKDVARLRPLKWAMVCNDPLSFGMSRMFATFAEGHGTYDVFSTEETARDWLESAEHQREDCT